MALIHRKRSDQRSHLCDGDAVLSNKDPTLGSGSAQMGATHPKCVRER